MSAFFKDRVVCIILAIGIAVGMVLSIYEGCTHPRLIHLLIILIGGPAGVLLVQTITGRDYVCSKCRSALGETKRENEKV